MALKGQIVALSSEDGSRLQKLRRSLFRGWLLIAVVTAAAGVGLCAFLLLIARPPDWPFCALLALLLVGGFVGCKEQRSALNRIDAALAAGTKRVVRTTALSLRISGSSIRWRTYITLDGLGELNIPFYTPRSRQAIGLAKQPFPVAVEVQLTVAGSVFLALDRLENDGPDVERTALL